MKMNHENRELTKIAWIWTTNHEFECNFYEIGRENLYNVVKLTGKTIMKMERNLIKNIKEMYMSKCKLSMG